MFSLYRFKILQSMVRLKTFEARKILMKYLKDHVEQRNAYPDIQFGKLYNILPNEFISKSLLILFKG